MLSYFQNNYGYPLKAMNFFLNTENFSCFSQVFVQNQDKAIYFQLGTSENLMAEGYIDDAYVLNLTDTFGSGMEPTQELVDTYIPYFDTTANIAVDSIEKLETKSFNYFVEKDANISCTNAEAIVSSNSISLSHVTGDVYCKVL